MGKLIYLNRYRRDQKRHYLSQHGAKLDSFIAQFLDRYMPFDFIKVVGAYQEYRRDNLELAWDYIDLREMIKDSMANNFGTVLLFELSMEPWFDPRYITIDDIGERCVSAFVTGW